MKTAALVLTATLSLLAAPAAFADGGNHNGNNNVGPLSGNLNGSLSGNNLNSRSASRASSRSTATQSSYNGVDGSGNSTNNFKERLQAPSFGVGGGWCSNGLSLSVPGGGFGFSSMDRMCKLQMGAEMVNRYINRSNAAAYMCNQREFANTVPACIRARAR